MDFSPNLILDGNDVNYESIIRVLQLDSELRIDSLPQQYVNRLLKTHGFSFNVLLLGQTGVGKTTLINSLFRRKFTEDLVQRDSNKVQIIANYYELKELDVKLELGVLETSGFGDQLDNDKPFEAVVEYIDNQLDRYLAEELRVDRRDRRFNDVKDTRVHVCLYLICSKGNSLSEIDVKTMKALDKRVNLIPLVAKADAITKEELNELKVRVMSEIRDNDIDIYRFPIDEPEVEEINEHFNSNIPFAIVASNDFVRVGLKDVRARVYPWGTVLVDDRKHSDLPLLRDSILRTNMYDLTVRTHSKHYELYRSERLDELWKDRQREHMIDMRSKEKELINRFTSRLRAKEQELKKNEKQLNQKFEKFSKERTEEKLRLDLDRQRLEEDIRAFHTRKLIYQMATNVGQESGLKTPTTSKKRFNK